MVEVGSIEIGGSIKTSEIERGMLRIQTGMKNISNAGKSVGADFERIGARGKALANMFGKIALVGGGALLALSKGAPALAGAMAKINLSMLKLKMSAGEALKPTFDKAAEALNGLAGWVDEHPDLFRGIVDSIVGLGVASAIIKTGGWLFKAWSGFFGIFKGMIGWGGWATLAEKVSSVATKASSAVSGEGIGAGIAGGLATGASVAGIAAGPLINTYFKDENGMGFLDRQVQDYQKAMFNFNLGQWSRNKEELQMEYMI